MLTNKDGIPTGAHKQYVAEMNSFNIKVLANHIASSLVETVKKTPPPVYPCNDLLFGRISTQADMESPWCRYWMNQLGIEFMYHRKYWELAYVAQVIHGHGKMGEGMTGLGFACGKEQLPSLFASRGCRITASDKPMTDGDTSQECWIQSGQYTSQKENLFYPNIVSHDVFSEQVNLVYINMNYIPENSDASYDFCWSVCAFEHLGSVRAGLDFLKNSLRLLKPGGISVHTTEFNYFNTHESYDNCGSVLFKKEHFEQLRAELEKENSKLLPIDYSIGNGVLDQYIDMPPWPDQPFDGVRVPYPFSPIIQPHLKLMMEGFPTTCIGVVFQRLH